jgi:hypothetical protein
MVEVNVPDAQADSATAGISWLFADFATSF